MSAFKKNKACLLLATSAIFLSYQDMSCAATGGAAAPTPLMRAEYGVVGQVAAARAAHQQAINDLGENVKRNQLTNEDVLLDNMLIEFINTMLFRNTESHSLSYRINAQKMHENAETYAHHSRSDLYSTVASLLKSIGEDTSDNNINSKIADLKRILPKNIPEALYILHDKCDILRMYRIIHPAHSAYTHHATASRIHP
ncbi:MAG: hypothetical protein V4482_04715 [Pseudomonadota bacterium]